MQIYEQFKRFNEEKNFHHYSLLKMEVRRVMCFGEGGGGFVRAVRVEVACSVVGWKLLGMMRIYPADKEYYRFMKKLGETM